MEIELVDDINDVMTSVTDMGEKSKSVVTAPFNDITNKNDDLCPLPKVTSLMSLLSQINVNDPDAGNKLVMAAAKSLEVKCAREGTPITPFEEFCKQQEEKTRKKNEEQREFIDVKFSEETKTVEDNLLMIEMILFYPARTKLMPLLYF